jgi:hypothetical protein
MKSSNRISPHAVCRSSTFQARFIKIVLFFVIICLTTPANAADLTIDVNAASSVRTIPETIYGGSMTAWFGFEGGGSPAYNNLMLAGGQKHIRWPGGSWGDAYLWSDMEGPGGVNSWIVNYNEQLNMLGILGATMRPIVNFPGYWYDTLQGHDEAVNAAVGWVADQGIRSPSALYWEIGNESFGPWEAGWFDGMCGSYYGDMFADFYSGMKAANPEIKIGAVAQPFDIPDWWNPGLWTRDLLVAADVNGDVVPDFLIIHSYPGTGMGAWYNPTLLSFDIDQVEAMTDSLNFIISDTIGPEYVGTIEYAMTEWNAGGVSRNENPENPYERWRLYSGALFLSQYIMEMAEHGWTVSNSFGDFFYQSWMGFPYPDYYVFPDWYVYPFFTNKLGRDMVRTTSSNPIIRAYAMRDDANDLTIFIANNSPDTDLTALINISGLAAGTDGQSWLMEPAGEIPPEGTVQDVENIQINGVFHPDPVNVNSLPAQSFTSAGSFEVELPKSCMLFIKVPNLEGQRPFGSTPHPIPGTIEVEDYDLGGERIAYHDTTAGNNGGEYRPDDVDIESCGEGGYNVTQIQQGEWLEFMVEVEQTGIYEIEARVACESSDGVFHIELDKMDITGPMSFSATGSPQTWTSVLTSNVILNPGQYMMRLVMDSTGFNVNWIKFTLLQGGSGNILREWWSDIFGTAVSDLTSNENFPCEPSGTELLTMFEGPMDSGDIYGARIRGYLHPVATGDYTFWIASDDNSELWLSSDDNPDNAVLIAYGPDWNNSREWDKYPQQRSTPISLTAGQRYYIEVLHKEGWGGDNVAVAWQGPGISRQVINGLYLSPYIDAPEIICPNDITLEATGPDGAIATFTVSATDLCDESPVITTDPCSGSLFPIGTTQVICTATNNKGNSSTCSFNVTVADTTPPEINVGDMILLWPANGQFCEFRLSDLVVSVEDAVDGPLRVNKVGNIILIYCDEPARPENKCNGRNERDIVILGHNRFIVRAERSIRGNGRVYGITFEVEDRAGNASVATCYIGVPRRAGQTPVDDGPNAGYTVFPDNDWFRHWWRNCRWRDLFRWFRQSGHHG